MEKFISVTGLGFFFFFIVIFIIILFIDLFNLFFSCFYPGITEPCKVSSFLVLKAMFR